jgi:hypothetical protein
MVKGSNAMDRSQFSFPNHKQMNKLTSPTYIFAFAIAFIVLYMVFGDWLVRLIRIFTR